MSAPAATSRRAFRAAEPAPRSRWARAWSIVTTAVLLVAGAFALLAVVIPLFLGAETYTVLTGSMRPGMPPGTLVAARETPAEDIRVGDVITYQLRPGEPAVVTHRVVGIGRDNNGETLFTTQGDANNTPDQQPVMPVQVRGVVVYAVPFLGYPGSWVGATTRSALVIVVGAAVILYGVIVVVADIVRSRRRRAAASLAVVLTLGSASLAMITAPQTAEAAPQTPEPAPADVLQLSLDGATWRSDGAVALFQDTGALAPGAPVPDDLWVRNASADPAQVSVVVSWEPASDDPGDVALAAGVALRAETDTVAGGERWIGPVLAPGETRRLSLALVLSPDAVNVTQQSAVVVRPVVSLTEYIPGDGTDPTAPAPDPGDLPATGGTIAVGAAVAGAGALAVGTWMLTRRRPRDG